VALIVTGGIGVSDRGVLGPGASKMTNEDEAKHHRVITEAVHNAGGKILMQALHGGRQSYHNQLVAPSAKQAPIYPFKPHALSADEVEQEIASFVNAALLAKWAGYDGVEIMGGIYAHENDKLNFERRKSGRRSSAGDVIVEKGHETLFNNIRGRLGNDLSVDEIVKKITAQGIGRVSGTILLGPICPVVKDPPDPKCADKPIFGTFIVQNAMGNVEFSRFGTLRDGSFSVPLPAGEYSITWEEPKGPGIQGRLVNVIAGETSEYAITFDTGIR